MGRQSLLGDNRRVIWTVGMNRRDFLRHFVNLCILHSLQGRVQRGSAARINSGVKDIEWLHGQELVSPWSCAATSVGGEAGSWNSAAAANMRGRGGSQGRRWRVIGDRFTRHLATCC